MKLSAVVTQLKKYAKIFEGRVASAAAYDTVSSQTVNFKRPSGFVVFDGYDFEESRNPAGKIVQTVRQTFYLYVELSTKSERGSELLDSIDELRKSVFLAIMGFRPDDECDPIQCKTISIDSINREMTVVAFEFFTEFSVGNRGKGDPAETWQDAVIDGLQPLGGIDFNVDVIDPVADPRPGPDGRIEAQFSTEFPTE